jgi:hypothetical protein
MNINLTIVHCNDTFLYGFVTFLFFLRILYFELIFFLRFVIFLFIFAHYLLRTVSFSFAL